MHEFGEEKRITPGLHLRADPRETGRTDLEVSHADHIIIGHGIGHMLRRGGGEGEAVRRAAMRLVERLQRFQPRKIFVAISEILVVDGALDTGKRRDLRRLGKCAHADQPPIKLVRAEAPGNSLHRLRLRDACLRQLIGSCSHKALCEALQRGLHAAPTCRNDGLEARAVEGQCAGTCQRAEHRRGDDRAFLARHLVLVEGDDAARGNACGGIHSLRIGDGLARLFLLRHGIGAVGGGDEQGAVRRHQPAQDGAARLHEFRGDHHVDIARRRHQRQHGRVAIFRRQHFDVVDRGAGALGDTRNGRRLRVPAIGLRHRDDPVRQHAAALPTHCENGNRQWLVAGDAGVKHHALTRANR